MQSTITTVHAALAWAVLAVWRAVKTPQAPTLVHALMAGKLNVDGLTCISAVQPVFLFFFHLLLFLLL